jgi:arginase
MSKFSLIPYHCGAGARVLGCELAPASLQAQGLHLSLNNIGVDAAWREGQTVPHGLDVPVLGSSARQVLVMEHLQSLRQEVFHACRRGEFPLSVGGDHSMAIGSIAGFAQAHRAVGKTGLLWVDAHLDANTPETTPSQALHGMPLAVLLGYGNSALLEITGGQPIIKPEHLCLIGPRSMEAGEEELLRRLGVRVFMAQEVAERGLAVVMEEALERLSRGTERRYLSFDIDAIDPQDAPAVGTPEAQGLRWAELQSCLPLLARAGFDGMDLTEYNPHFDADGTTYQLVEELLNGILQGFATQNLHSLAA